MKQAISVGGLAAVLLLTLALSLDSVGRAEARSRGATLTGTWFLTTAAGITELNSYGRDGTVTGVNSVIFGGPPRPGANRSGDHGIWRRLHGRLFESIVYRFVFDSMSGDVTNIIRIRLVFSLDLGFDSAAGEFFVTRWACPTALTCPDPNVAVPTVPEFGPPGNTFTMTRMTLP